MSILDNFLYVTINTMSHTCSSALIRCIDFRLTSAIDKWMVEKGIMDDCDVISVAGIGKAIAENPESADAKYILNQIALSKKLHDIKTLYLVHHTDCGAYGGHAAFDGLESEKQCYSEDMKKAHEVISAQVPEIEINHMLADIRDDGKIVILEQ